MGHLVPKTFFKGRRRHFRKEPDGEIKGYSSVNVQRFSARLIGCCGYDTPISRSRNSFLKSP
jgi:hypothetical protein